MSRFRKKSRCNMTQWTDRGELLFDYNDLSERLRDAVYQMHKSTLDDISDKLSRWGYVIVYNIPEEQLKRHFKKLDETLLGCPVYIPRDEA